MEVEKSTKISPKNVKKKCRRINNFLTMLKIVFKVNKQNFVFVILSNFCKCKKRAQILIMSIKNVQKCHEKPCNVLFFCDKC